MGANQGNTRMALAVALDPDSCQVDERDHSDRLAFVANFATLVLYYDKNNQVAGEWSRFFLKDPAILMAAISKAQVGSYFSGCFSSPLLSAEASKRDDEDTATAAQLCMLITHMLVLVDRWFHFMGQAPGTYVLHGFLKTQIEGPLCGQLRRLLALQQTLSMSTQGAVAPPDRALFAAFERVWHVMSDDPREPQEDPVQQGLRACCEELQQMYQQVFSVFTQVVDYAGVAFKECQDHATRFPDTALLRVFSRLMAIQQNEINQLGRKHLDFYYQKILRQDLRAARADQVHVCLSLSAKVEDFTLPAGTPFKAGTYADGSDIIFANDESVPLNRATVTQVNTLFYSSSGPDAGLYLGTVTDPGKLTQDPIHGIGSWDAFGNVAGVAVQQGFAFGSPMLLLQGGTRSITIQLQLLPMRVSAGPFASADARYYLSTEKGWWQVTPSVPVADVTDDTITLHFVLKPGDPAIVALKPAPDDASSQWPMFKAVPGATLDLHQPYGLLAVSICVNVTGFSQWVLANDSAVLSTTGVLLPFGPVPVTGQGFYVGSNECFAKPLTDFSVSMNWEGLPADFEDYYAAYNDYLADGASRQEPTFTNQSVKVSWSLLKDKGWSPLRSSLNTASINESNITALFQQTGANAHGVLAADPHANADFSKIRLYPCQDPIFVPVPELALAPLPSLRLADAGYVRMQLSGPSYAFGHSLYAKVVASISLQNARYLIELAQTKPEPKPEPVFSRLCRWLGLCKGVAPADSPNTDDFLRDLPNLPYSPILKSVVANYTARMTFTVARSAPDANTSYPFEIYHYGSFKPYLAYDASRPHQACGFAQLTPQAKNDQNLLPLYPGVTTNDCLYMALSNLVAPCTLSLFLDVLTDEQRVVSGDEKVTCYYWAASGWLALDVLSDATYNLSCSGIIKLDIPSGEVCPVMPADGFWLAIAAPVNARHIRFTYLNTQGIKLHRCSVLSVPEGEVPLIGPNTLLSTQHKLKQVATVVQPFASTGGQPSEDKASYGQTNSFYRRVSTRLNHKDRASSHDNYIEMALQACPSLYYARVLKSLKQPSIITVGLLNGYTNAEHPHAFRPLISAGAQVEIQQYLAQRVSAMAQVCVQNLQHQIVRIKAQLVLSPGVSAHALFKELNQTLRLYMSPWIVSDSPQMDIEKGLGRSELTALLGSHPDVLTVISLDLYVVSNERSTEVPDAILDDPLMPAEGAILVTAEQHSLAVASRPAGQEGTHG